MESNRMEPHTQQVAETTEGQSGSSQVAELRAIHLALDIAEREKWPRLYLYTDSWMVANTLWGWLDRWKKANWQRKPIWASKMCSQGIIEKGHMENSGFRPGVSQEEDQNFNRTATATLDKTAIITLTELGPSSGPTVVWKFAPEQLQDPVKVIKYVKENCCSSSREVKSYATCWTLATIYRTLLITRQHPQGQEEESRLAGTVATQTAAEPEDQPMPVAVIPIQMKKCNTKSVCLVRDEEEAGPSHQEEEARPKIITRSLSLDGSEAKQLASLSQDVGIDKGIGKRTETQPLETTPVKCEGKVELEWLQS
ncbi:hypothetical protein BTVI_65902 [Pitangus sulphuratus]|nr:hypothetical protein BTVI_65902 [Pitangus sulphuratus]